MAFEQNFSESAMHFEFEGDVPLKHKWDMVSAPAESSETGNGSFDCNICLDSAQDPVVTLCGHLYCWPCIYKWLQVQNPSFESVERPKCPVCKTNISKSSLVPLYGHGLSPSESEAKKPQMDLIIPPRPAALGINSLLNAAAALNSHPNQQLHPNPFQPQAQSFHHQQYLQYPFGNYAPITPSNIRSTAVTNFFSPTLHMFGEMVFSRMFGGVDPNLFSYPNAYPLSGSGSPRMRRQEMHMEKSLSRVSIFFLCCIVLCLLLF